MPLQSHNSVTVSRLPRGGWRVRAFHMPADWNALGRTLAEQNCRTEAAARKLADRYARDYAAEIIS